MDEMTLLGAVFLILGIVVVMGVLLYFVIRPKAFSDFNSYAGGFFLTTIIIGIIRLLFGQSLELVGVITLLSLYMGIFSCMIALLIAKMRNEM
jgi:hypothetical protein